MRETFFFLFRLIFWLQIPNPLFDLAGILCGHFGVKFFTFWGATFVGKALVKNNIQSMGIILLFSEDILDWLLQRLRVAWPFLHGIVQQFLDAQVRQFKGGHKEAEPREGHEDASFYLVRT